MEGRLKVTGDETIREWGSSRSIIRLGPAFLVIVTASPYWQTL